MNNASNHSRSVGGSVSRISQCVISFGSNLGERHELIATAAREIASSALVSQVGLLRTSRLFQTPPIGGPGGQEPFLNAIAAFDTNASAREVLDLLQKTESKLGRERRRRWDARSIDLDVVLHGELVGGGTGLIVPHPRYTARQFVLVPACDVAAHFRDPRFGWTLERLAQHLTDGVPSLALVGDIETRRELCRRVREEYGIQVFEPGTVPDPMPVLGNAPLPVRASKGPSDAVGGGRGHAEKGETIESNGQTPWVAGYLPALPDLSSDETKANSVPRLVVRIQRTSSNQRWPAPHQMWPSGWTWPEYRLEVDDMKWAAGEIASALQSMRCHVEPVTNDGDWW